ncbi:MAG: two-component regulator propeller domain-containing protein, partial [Saprospiraceae bacterium]|nr:two-component regulator propeller domain-containing protein [Saprospiraceae bacterium]
ISAMEEDKNGQLWIGTNAGLVHYNPKSKEFSSYFNNPKDPKTLIDNAIMDIYCTPKGQIWIASPRGLSKLILEEGKVTFKHYTEKEGLPNSFVYGILPDKHNRLWLSTNAGLSCFNPQTGLFRNYDSNDGLASREFNSGGFCRSPDGELFFGGLGVLVSFKPEQMVENQHLPHVALTSFKKAENEQPLEQLLANGGIIRLRHTDNFLSFNFAALDFTNPDKNEFSYRLKGLSDKWIGIKNRRNISFPHLAPGNYVLEVKGANSQAHWNEDNILKIPIYIAPPFWRTWWFYLLTSLLTAVVVISAYRYRVQMKVQRAVELERVKLEENERVRKLAAQDIHDEFGNTLTRISLLTELIKAKSLNGSSEISNLLNKISDNASRMYQGTKDFIWAINPEHDSCYEIAIRLKDFADDAFDTTGINFDVQGIDNSLKMITLPMGASRHLVMLFKEAMTNTLKHAQATEACLCFALNNSILKIEWKDNGIGFNTTNNHAGNGLQNMQSRAKRIGSEVKIESCPEIGTTVRIELNTAQTKIVNPNRTS